MKIRGVSRPNVWDYYAPKNGLVELDATCGVASLSFWASATDKYSSPLVNFETGDIIFTLPS